MSDKPPLHFDVVIIGGGPAGLSAAITLLKHTSLSVAVIEKTDFKNPRVGETVPPSLLPLLRYLGLESDFLRGSHLQSFGFDAAWGNSHLLSRDFLFTTHGNGWHLDRIKFDNMMANKIIKKGGQLFTIAEIINQKQTRKKIWQVIMSSKNKDKLRINANFILDTSGKNAIFARSLGSKWRVLDNLVGFVCYYQLEKQKAPQRMLIESVSNGWWYSSPLPRNRTIVVFMTDSDIGRKLNVIENWNFLIGKTMHIKKTTGGRPISPIAIFPAYSHVIKKIQHKNWLPAGEAASSFDPISSMGIGYAILSGIHAAKTAYEYVQFGNDLILNYMESISKNFSRYLRHRHYYYTNEKRWKESIFWKRRQTDKVQI